MQKCNNCFSKMSDHVKVCNSCYSKDFRAFGAGISVSDDAKKDISIPEESKGGYALEYFTTQ